MEEARFLNEELDPAIGAALIKHQEYSVNLTCHHASKFG
jgi:hypothetical protein